MASRFTIKGVAIGAIALASFTPWIYRWSGQADRPFPDTLNEATFAVSAEPVCASGVADLPNALSADNGQERAEQIRQGTAQLQAMVDELSDLVAGTERDQRITRAWLADWQTYINDRLGYADRIAADENAIFYVTQLDGQERLEKRISRFATTNRMNSCVTPGDIG